MFDMEPAHLLCVSVLQFLGDFHLGAGGGDDKDQWYVYV